MTHDHLDLLQRPPTCRLAGVLGVPGAFVVCKQTRAGGAFGPKNSRQVPVAAMAAVAAHKRLGEALRWPLRWPLRWRFRGSRWLLGWFQAVFVGFRPFSAWFRWCQASGGAFGAASRPVLRTEKAVRVAYEASLEQQAVGGRHSFKAQYKAGSLTGRIHRNVSRNRVEIE